VGPQPPTQSGELQAVGPPLLLAQPGRLGSQGSEPQVTQKLPAQTWSQPQSVAVVQKAAWATGGN